MKNASHVSITEAKQRLGELVKRVAYGGEEIVIQFRGKPAAVLTPYPGSPEDLEKKRQLALLKSMTELSDEIEKRTGIQPDSAEAIRKMREERDDHLLGLR